MSKHTLTHKDLAQFTGSLVQYVHPFFGYKYTEGVRYLAEAGGAWWLLDAIYSWQSQLLPNHKQLGEFQLWTLTVADDQTAELVCQEDTASEVLASQQIEYTDFPLDSIKIYLIEGIMLLPSEY